MGVRELGGGLGDVASASKGVQEFKGFLFFFIYRWFLEGTIETLSERYSQCKAQTFCPRIEFGFNAQPNSHGRRARLTYLPTGIHNVRHKPCCKTSSLFGVRTGLGFDTLWR